MSSSNTPPAFETSFDNDVSFKSLIQSTDGSEIDHQTLPVPTTATNNLLRGDKKDDRQEDQGAPEDLNFFITDLLEQMVRFFCWFWLTIISK